MPSRRAVLLLPVLAAACETAPEPAVVLAGPMRFDYLTPLPLNVASIEVGRDTPPPMGGDVGARLSPGPAEAVRIMARDRLIAVGTTGTARVTVTQSALVPGRDSLTCLLGCRLDILSAEGERLGFVEAQSRRVVTGPDAARPRAAEALLRQTMDDLNVEFEFQLRRALKDWLVQAPPGQDGTLAAPPPAAVEMEDLPRR
ncbi:hypothetical protein [Roseicella aquatilis]|uniref:ABC-type transport auxiliary lipoprotein component domain-containing protein n=1 Tax=Roseicella aquatilis TaxID=2527868 RepID=A0A4R4DUP8_9PROT|nr:hypothetical protein [Roseicella aquatilis]TCZ64010.1 hypothetical protein EXY23_08550 [Roseicella aquatilis]